MIRCRVARASLLLLIALANGPEFVGAESSKLPFKPSPVPGGVVIIPVHGTDQAPAVVYHGEPVLTRRSATGWVAVVGIPLSAKPGQDEIDVDGKPVPFAIKPKRYPEQRVQLKNQRMVNPNAEDEARIAKEMTLTAPAWQARPEQLTPSLSFRQPTPGSLTASFGMRRIFNGEPRSPHQGLDIRAPQGQAVCAPAAGMVVLTGDFFFAGKAVFLAHGEGVVSLLCHLSRITVKEGQVLKAGERVGDVGATGRASGPHLHWSLSLNNARVDPRIFLGSQP